ncbi:MAG: bifunctional 5,10-methylene-tetrahydrofolate dehydrogenase/5,10-methylene-tetrahydrofolate cyclohydrolase [Sphingobacteriales bacterium]|jgi:methylenetetrahydrofolate dehydrogenase (NADP+)/methenyltetrahydrofolate cyclohydrolase|nr:bifunctional 5,10-methylene-tetrahydrofolate dehydrogenase/5,10-methylene-tetrahydrofolate cyclohydrolase [Sphingobacteriales bacterium]
MELLDGKKIAAEIKIEIKKEVDEMIAMGLRAPNLVAILVGEDGASETYVNSKAKNCAEVGFTSSVIRLPKDTTEEFLLNKIIEINNDDAIDGLIVQLPLPDHISVTKVVETIDYRKDVDGFHPINIGRMNKNLPCYISATPNGIMMLLERYKINTSGMHCVVVGRSNIVGSPMSILMALNAEPGNATVTICHSKTPDISRYTKDADIVIVAIGKKNYLTADMIKDGAIVIDVGMNRELSDKTKSGYKLYGDVDFENVSKKASWITPVPGGVGLMTIVSLLKNTLAAAKKTYYN